MRRQAPQTTGNLRGLERVQDVVDLGVLLAAACLDVRASCVMRLEPIGVCATEIEPGRLAQHLAHDSLSRAGGLGDPDRLGKEEALRIRGLAEQRVAVDGEGEVPVEGLFDAGRVHLRHQQARGIPGVREVVLGKRSLRSLMAVGLALELVGKDRQRIVGIRANAHALPALAVVDIAILVAHHRQDRLDWTALDALDRVRPGEAVLQRLQRNRATDQLLELGTPEAAGDEQLATVDAALRGLHTTNATLLDAYARHLRALHKAHAGFATPLLQRVADRDRTAEAVGRHVVRGQDHALVENGAQLDRLLRRDDVSLEAVGHCSVAAALQLAHAVGRRCHFEAADCGPGLAVGRVVRVVGLRAPLSERAEQATGAGLKDQAGCVVRRAARVAERTLVDDDHVRDARFDEFPSYRGADNACTDDDDVSLAVHRSRSLGGASSADGGSID